MSIQILGAIVAQSRVGIGLVDDDTLHQAGEGDDYCAQSSRFHPSKNLRLHLCVPGVVGFAPFHHGAGHRNRIAAALEDYPVEIGRRAPVEGVALVDGPFVGLETG